MPVRGHNLPSGLVTFLFTDIEGSTRLAQMLGTGYRPVLSEHRRLLRHLLAEGGGTELFTEGETFFVAFSEAVAAVRLCVAAQRALAAHEWPSPESVPRVRMGLHTGRAEAVNGEYASAQVHRASRIAAAAHGGQVLCSSGTARHAAPLSEGVSLLDLGLYRLRGFDDRERLFQVDARGLEQQFPRPRTGDAFAHNLPSQVTSFVGRETERAELVAIIAGNRLVTVVGGAGTGKTRLAIEAARDLIDPSPDGVWFVSFARAGGANTAAAAVAMVLGLRAEPGRSLVDTVVEFAASRRLLLVLDGCDAQPSAVAELVRRLLSAGNHLRVLATSRTPFGMPSEVVRRIRPLPSEAPPDQEHSPAMTLLLDRVEAARGGHPPSPQDLADLRRITSRLAGNPAAIERAALTLGEMSTGQLLEQLPDNDLTDPLAAPTDQSPDSSEFFLFLGASDTDIALAKVRIAGLRHRKTLLASPPEDWDSVIDTLAHPSLKGVIAAFTADEYQLIAEPANHERAKRLLESMSHIPHIVLVRETTLAGPSSATNSTDGTHPFSSHLAHQDRWRDGEEVRTEVNTLFEQKGLNVLPYRTRPEMSSLIVSFIEDNERDLLFRVYIPSGRLYAQEADRLLALFRDWLGQVRRHSIRQDGYRTAAGQVYEFFGDGSLDQRRVSQEFETFSDFLALCTDDPDAATDRLARAGIDPLTGDELVRRYGRDVRRIHLDLRHSREARLLTLRHSLESELLDATQPPKGAQLQMLLEHLIPATTAVNPDQILLLSRPLPTAATQLTLNVHQQFISRVEGHVTQNIRGTVHLGTEAKDLLALIERFGGNTTNDLESALHELEDPASRPTDRLNARQRLKAFLIRIQGHVEAGAIAILQRYVETKLGLS